MWTWVDQNNGFLNRSWRAYNRLESLDKAPASCILLYKRNMPGPRQSTWASNGIIRCARRPQVSFRNADEQWGNTIHNQFGQVALWLICSEMHPNPHGDATAMEHTEIQQFTTQSALRDWHVTGFGGREVFLETRAISVVTMHGVQNSYYQYNHDHFIDELSEDQYSWLALSTSECRRSWLRYVLDGIITF